MLFLEPRSKHLCTNLRSLVHSLSALKPVTHCECTEKQPNYVSYYRRTWFKFHVLHSHVYIYMTLWPPRRNEGIRFTKNLSCSKYGSRVWISPVVKSCASK